MEVIKTKCKVGVADEIAGIKNKIKNKMYFFSSHHEPPCLWFKAVVDADESSQNMVMVTAEWRYIIHNSCLFFHSSASLPFISVFLRYLCGTTSTCSGRGSRRTKEWDSRSPDRNVLHTNHTTWLSHSASSTRAPTRRLWYNQSGTCPRAPIRRQWCSRNGASPRAPMRSGPKWNWSKVTNK